MRLEDPLHTCHDTEREDDTINVTSVAVPSEQLYALPTSTSQASSVRNTGRQHVYPTRQSTRRDTYTRSSRKLFGEAIIRKLSATLPLKIFKVLYIMRLVLYMY